MPIAAVPDYLGTDFSSASPGQRFGMYLRLWGVDSRNREHLWSTHDVNYRSSGQAREERSFKDENKSAALREASRLTSTDLRTMAALHMRQQALAEPLISSSQVLRLDAISVAPFATGLGIAHPLENGFAFLDPYGLPYLPGSSVKGVLRQAARELADGLFGDTAGWDAGAIDALFGKRVEVAGAPLQRGALSFWDVLPQLSGDALKVDVMTAHQSHYYQNGESPHESGQPIPITFLSVPPGSGFAFHARCDRSFLRLIAPEWAIDDRWQGLLQSAFVHAFAWLGFGAKTAVGYGAMRVDQQALDRREARTAAAHKQAEAIRAEQQRAAELAAMTPLERKLAEVLDAKPADQPEENAMLKALEAGLFDAAEKPVLAQRIAARLRQSGRWRETTQKKNPDKDKEYQVTLQVKRWLGPAE